MKNRLSSLTPAGGTNGKRRHREPLEEEQQPGMGRRVFNRASQSIGDYPVASLAAAFVTGLLIAAWVKRT